MNNLKIENIRNLIKKNRLYIFLPRKLSKLEHEFKNTYAKLSEQAAGFATELLDQTRGSEELEVILNHDTELSTQVNSHGMTLSRLKLAIKYKQREVKSTTWK